MPSKKHLLDIISIQTEIARLGLDLGATMALIVNRTLPLIGAEGAAIELAEGEEMVYRAAAGIAKSKLGFRLDRKTSLSGLCVQTGEILCCDDSELDSRVDRDACRLVGLRSMIVVPLKHGSETVGVLKALSSLPGKFNKSHIAVLRLLSNLIAASMFYSSKYNIDQLFYQATHDAMTGLANRAMFADRLRNVIAQCERSREIASVLIIDMDGLKYINDTYGHRVGDAAIVEFANRLNQCARRSDMVARLGGDEFSIILSPVDLSAHFDPMIQRIDTKINQPLLFEGKNIPLGASIGAAEFPIDGTDTNSLLEVADKRMYRVKKQHKSACSVPYTFK